MKNFIEYKGYYGSVSYSYEDEVFFGKIEGINDLVNFEGESVEEIKKSFEEAVDDYLEFCAETGKDPDKTYKGVFNVRVSPDLHKKASLLAKKKRMKLNELVRKSIRRIVDNENLI